MLKGSKYAYDLVINTLNRDSFESMLEFTYL
jgi:hypothetical protein